MQPQSVLLQKRRDKTAVKRCFKRVLRLNPVPRKFVTNQLRNYSAAKAEILKLFKVQQVFVTVWPVSTTEGRIAVDPHESASVARGAFANRSVRRPSCRASVPSGGSLH